MKCEWGGDIDEYDDTQRTTTDLAKLLEIAPNEFYFIKGYIHAISEKHEEKCTKGKSKEKNKNKGGK